VEAGLSASGAALGWVSFLTGRTVDALVSDAAQTEPGAGGLVALPWLHGARAPWWRPGVRAAFVGLGPHHGPAHLARAVVEAVALDVARCIDLVAPDAEALALAGAGAASPLWQSVLSAATARPLQRRAVDDGASVGARVVLAAALEHHVTLDTLSPVVQEIEPEPALVERYRALRARSDEAAAAIIALDPSR
jgi:sugar (pentulose or hexulose) kinase